MPKLTQEDYKRHLEEQIHFLKKSCKEYDNGDYLEYKQMSVRLRVLLHDTKKSTSLLTHLNKKNIKFYDTSKDINPNYPHPEDGLIDYKVDVDPEKPTVVTFNPPLGYGDETRYIKGKLSFNTWQNHVIIDDKQGNSFTRIQLIKTVCNKDGGAHVDTKITSKYINSFKKHSVLPISVKGEAGGGIQFSQGKEFDTPHENEGIFKSSVMAASVRQITYEVLKSLEDEFPEYFND